MSKPNQTYWDDLYDKLEALNLISPEYQFIYDALALLPKQITDWVYDNVLFLTPQYDSDAISISFDGYFMKDSQLKPRKAIIHFSPLILKKQQKEKNYIVAHEIAHAYLGHKFETIKRDDDKEHEKHENEADRLATKWLGYTRGSWMRRNKQRLSL